MQSNHNITLNTRHIYLTDETHIDKENGAIRFGLKVDNDFKQNPDLGLRLEQAVEEVLKVALNDDSINQVKFESVEPIRDSTNQQLEALNNVLVNKEFRFVSAGSATKEV